MDPVAFAEVAVPVAWFSIPGSNGDVVRTPLNAAIEAEINEFVTDVAENVWPLPTVGLAA